MATKTVIDRFQSKLTPWKAKNLSFGGRLTLIKSVLGSLPTYFFSLFVAPTCVLNKLEKIRRQFLWGYQDGKSKINWVAWDKVVSPKESGGLGVGSLAAQNISLIVKWWWRFRVEHTNLWSKVVRGIHNSFNKPADTIAKKTIPGVWNNIAGIVKSLNRKDIAMSNIIKRKVGDGKEIFFWLDSWCGSKPFKEEFPDLFILEKKKRCRLADRLVDSSWVWDWTSPLTDSESSRLAVLIRVAFRPLLSPSPDSWFCNLSCDGSYQVHLLRDLLDSSTVNIIGGVMDWFHEVPIKVGCFVWRALLGRIPANSELSKRGVPITSNSCGSCSSEAEDTDHILLNCSYAKEVWGWIFKWCNIQMTPCNKISGLLEYASKWGRCPKKRKVLICICYGTIWALWKARNDRCFNGIHKRPPLVADMVKSMVFLWLKHRRVNSTIKEIEWHVCPL